jgi:hypothetical protein
MFKIITTTKIPPTTDTIQYYNSINQPVTTLTKCLHTVFLKLWCTLSGTQKLSVHEIDFFFNDATTPGGPGPPQLSRLDDHTQDTRHSDRPPLDDGSARRKDLYLTKHNTHKRHTCMPPAGFEPAVPASRRPQTDALDRAATGICRNLITVHYVSTYFEKYSNKIILRSNGKTHKSSELVDEKVRRVAAAAPLL